MRKLKYIEKTEIFLQKKMSSSEYSTTSDSEYSTTSEEYSTERGPQLHLVIATGLLGLRDQCSGGGNGDVRGYEHWMGHRPASAGRP